MLRRALLYAIERKRAELIAADLHASQLRARENALLERGLLPSPLLLDNPGVEIVARYRPSREDALLCGDFYDVVQTPDRVVHVLIGDVAGHGPDEAALGAALRIAWRALTFAGVRRRRTDAAARADPARRTHRHRDLRDGAQPGDPARRRARSPRSGPVIPGCCCTAATRWNGSSRRPGRRWACTPTTGRSTSWNCRWVTGCCCSPTGSSRGIAGRGNERLGEDGLLALARAHARSARSGVRRRAHRRRRGTRPAARRAHRRHRGGARGADHRDDSRAQPLRRAAAHGAGMADSWCCSPWACWCWRARWSARRC